MSDIRRTLMVHYRGESALLIHPEIDLEDEIVGAFQAVLQDLLDRRFAHFSDDQTMEEICLKE